MLETLLLSYPDWLLQFALFVVRIALGLCIVVHDSDKLGFLKSNPAGVKGFVGWLFWSLAHIYFLIGLRNRFVVAFNWFWDYITFQRGARLITEVPQGPGRDAEPGRQSTQQKAQAREES